MDTLYLQNSVGVAATPLDELLTKNLGLEHPRLMFIAAMRLNISKIKPRSGVKHKPWVLTQGRKIGKNERRSCDTKT